MLLPFLLLCFFFTTFSPHYFLPLLFFIIIYLFFPHVPTAAPAAPPPLSMVSISRGESERVQHLANPSQPSGSYKREDSQESSVLSDDSMPPLIAVGALRPNSFSSRSSQSPASCQSAATSGSYAAGGRASDVVVEPRRSVKRMRSPSIESTSGSEVGTTVPFSLQPQVKSDHERTASRESVLPAMAWGTRVGNDTYGATATTGALVAKDKAFAAKPAAAAAQVDAVGRGMLEMATLHQKLFTRGQGSQSSGLSSSSGESKRRVVSG